MVRDGPGGQSRQPSARLRPCESFHDCGARSIGRRPPPVPARQCRAAGTTDHGVALRDATAAAEKDPTIRDAQPPPFGRMATENDTAEKEIGRVGNPPY